MNHAIETKAYKTDSGQYMKAVAELWAGRWWWTIALPIATCFILAYTVNVAFVFVGLMLVFIVVPMIMSLLYFYYAFSPEAIIAIRNKRLHIIPNERITINYEPIEENTETPYPSTSINWDEIVMMEYRNRDIMLRLSGSRYRFLLIPYEAIGTLEQQTSLLTHFPQQQ